MSATIPRRRGLRRRWLIGGVLLVIATIGAALVIANPGQQTAYGEGDYVTVTRGDITSTISGTGTIAAAQTVRLAFQMSGTVTEVLVEPGDRVEAGQVMARLDERALRIQLENAEASLEVAEAQLKQAQEGNASPEEIAAAKAALAQAEASYERVVSAASAEDVAAARAAVASAEASYAAAVAAAEATDSQVESARAALERAEIALQRAQVEYAEAVEEDSTDTTALAAYQTALVDYEQAKANYESVSATTGASASSGVQSARASLEQARANLASLTGGASEAEIASAQASVDQAAANLARLTAPATETTIAIAASGVRQAELAVEQAQLNLEAATLEAPFAGVVTAVEVVEGGQASMGAVAVELMDTANMHVDLRLNENDVAEVSVGLPVRVTVDSVDGWETEGEVEYIAPAAETVNGVVTYETRVTFRSDDERLKVGMTATLDIITAQKEDVLLVPTTALMPYGVGYVVEVPSEDGATVTQVHVETGLSDNTYTEIISGLDEGDRIVALPNAIHEFGGMFASMRGGG